MSTNQVVSIGRSTISSAPFRRASGGDACDVVYVCLPVRREQVRFSCRDFPESKGFFERTSSSIKGSVAGSGDAPQTPGWVMAATYFS